MHVSYLSSCIFPGSVHACVAIIAVPTESRQSQTLVLSMVCVPYDNNQHNVVLALASYPGSHREPGYEGWEPRYSGYACSGSLHDVEASS